jgi:ABC-type branched-subunit amino acid transport system substrate-binding protein
VVIATLAAACSRAPGSAQQAATTSSSAAASPASGGGGGSFGTLDDVCHGGPVSGSTASGSTDQGVTSGSIKVGVMSDYRFTKDPELVNAATVFTDWCNAQGGIDGRKLVADVQDTQLMAVIAAMTRACASDFVLAGGSAALDGLAVSTRLNCLLPDFDAEPVMPQNQGSGLQVMTYATSPQYSGFAGYYKWLLAKYPGSAGHVGVLSGESVITQVAASAVAQTVKADGGAVAYNGTFPPVGVTNWTPYAEAIKAHGIKGLTFFDTPTDLAALERTLDTIGYHLDWIDANTNAYGTGFIQVAGNALTQQHNYADLPGIWPVEKASGDPAVAKIVQLFQQYAPGQPVTLQVEEAFSAWLLFAVAAQACGPDLTRLCVYQAALKQTAWTGGGISAPVDEATLTAPPTCFNIEEATPGGWQPAAGFTPNTDGTYSCGQEPTVTVTGAPAAVQLSAVGKSLSDLR